MAETPSRMIALNTKAPNFCLLDTVTNKPVFLKDIKSNIATVVMFICNHCPYVILIRNKLVEVCKEYQLRGISFVAICSNDATKYPEDGPLEMKKVADACQFSFPYLYDETQAVAKAYQATCTPDFFIYDKDLLCIYRGRFDNARPSNKEPVTGNDIKFALDSILLGQTVTEDQKPSVGCNIKWK